MVGLMIQVAPAAKLRPGMGLLMVVIGTVSAENERSVRRDGRLLIVDPVAEDAHLVGQVVVQAEQVSRRGACPGTARCS